MKEGPVWIIIEALIKLVLPDDASSPVQIDHLEAKRGFALILDESYGPLQPCVRPCVRPGISIIDTSEGSMQDFVAL